ncbi:probable polyol transporter 4 [Rhodamnia argentea]|uniref:Probable polyol transporter 4 n=1 Tax=Rhodamnia argentea TaxID=178133 RepID=A0ABM3HMJ0_9MYRT|nr:probable polyol transporter 4 [Rhodamnia argentea]
MGLVGIGEEERADSLKGMREYKRMGSKVEDDDFEDDLVHYQRQLKRRKSTRIYVFACAVFVSLNSLLLGYDGGAMSGAIIFIQEDLRITEVQIEVLVGCLNIISLFGSIAGGRTSDIIGRKWTMGLGAVVFQAGVAVMTFADSFRALMIGRLLAGVGMGFGGMITSLYIAEISPTISRGTLTSFPEIFVNLGILLGYISNYAFAGLSVHINWRVMLGVGILPSVFLGLALFVIPESPRWLVMQNRVDEARLVLLKTHEDEREAEERLAGIQVAAGAGNSASKHGDKSVWLELLCPSPPLRRMLIAGIGIQCFQQITGIDAAVVYSPTIFKSAGTKGNSNLLAATVAVGVTKTSFILVAIFLIDKIGRKPLLYVSTIGMTVCLLSVAVSLSLLKEGVAGAAPLLAILSVCSYVAFFSIGIGPICWVLSSEIFPLRYRAQAAALGAAGNRVCSGLITMSFLSVSRAITVAGTFFVFAALSAASVAFVYSHVPETRGKSLEQIESLFQNPRDRKGSHVEMEDVEHLVQ